MKVEINVFEKYPMERKEEYKRFVAEYIVLEGQYDIASHNHPKSKRVVRKTLSAAFEIAKKWNEQSVSKGTSVRLGLGLAL